MGRSLGRLPGSAAFGQAPVGQGSLRYQGLPQMFRQVLEHHAGQEIKKLSDRLTRVKDTPWDQALNAWHERWRGFIDERTLLQHHGLAEDHMRQACEWWSRMKSANPNHTSLIRENTTTDRRKSTGTSRRTNSRATTPPSPTPPHCPNGTRPGEQASVYDRDTSDNRNQSLKHHV